MKIAIFDDHELNIWTCKQDIRRITESPKQNKPLEELAALSRELVDGLAKSRLTESDAIELIYQTFATLLTDEALRNKSMLVLGQREERGYKLSHQLLLVGEDK